MAFAASAVFLRMHGYRVRVSADDAERFLIDRVIVERAEVPPIASWLETHMHATARR